MTEREYKPIPKEEPDLDALLRRLEGLRYQRSITGGSEEMDRFEEYLEKLIAKEKAKRNNGS